MSEKPGKRLVTWERYLETAARKGVAYSLAYVLLGSGLTLIFLSLLLCFTGLACWLFADTWFVHRWEGRLFSVLSGVSGGLAAVVGGVLARGAYTLSIKARKIARVVLITRHNAGLLPAVETLVRASDLPPSHHQSELLRAAKPGQETPAEELLRASVTEGTGEQNDGW